MVSYFSVFFFFARGGGDFLAVLTVVEPTEANPNLNNAFVISNKMILACVSVIKSKYLTDNLGIAKNSIFICTIERLYVFFVFFLL